MRLLPRRRRRIAFLFRRDGDRCSLCGDEMDFLLLETHDDLAAPTIDHVLPKSMGGSGQPENLRLAHKYCNNQRGDQPVDDSPWAMAWRRERLQRALRKRAAESTEPPPVRHARAPQVQKGQKVPEKRLVQMALHRSPNRRLANLAAEAYQRATLLQEAGDAPRAAEERERADALYRKLMGR